MFERNLGKEIMAKNLNGESIASVEKSYVR